MNTVHRRDRRETRLGYSVMASATVVAGLGVLAADIRLRVVAFVLALAGAWALHLAVSRTRRRLACEAVTDPLTGLYNRRYLGDRLVEEVERARRSAGVFTVALVDIDDFKRFNDRHGHQRGDQMLAAAAEGLRTRLRGADLVFRYGGEEFLVIFPDTPADAAGEALRRVFDGIHGVTFSGGLAECPGEARDAPALIGVADHRLRQAKHAGKARLLSSL